MHKAGTYNFSKLMLVAAVRRRTLGIDSAVHIVAVADFVAGTHIHHDVAVWQASLLELYDPNVSNADAKDMHVEELGVELLQL